MADIAAGNAAANGLAHLHFTAADVTVWRPDEPFDHALANPPWHKADGTPPPDAGRERAKMAEPDLLARWAQNLAGGLRRRGTLSLILPASSSGAGMAALRQAHCPEITLLPLWPRTGQPARLVLLQGVRDGGGPDRLLPGLVLHEADGHYTPAAERILRYGDSLP